MVWDKPTAGEYDANSPMHVILWGKVIDCLVALQSGGAVKNTGLNTTELEMEVANSTVMAKIQDSVYLGGYGFYPMTKCRGTDAGKYGRLRFFPSTGIQFNVFSTTYYAWVELYSNSSHVFDAKWRTVRASRDFPVIYIARNKNNGFIYSSFFDPECSGEDHPFGSITPNDGADPEDIEILCVQLKHSKALREHLFSKYHVYKSWLHQFDLGLITGAIKISDKTIDPLMPKRTKKTDDFLALGLPDPNSAPALHSENIKLVDFEFNPPE
jgi:hypothetical protein